MAEELTVPKSAEELEEQLGTAFRSGDIGQTAFITWELMNRFPEKAGVARVYAKKILRDPEIVGLTVDALRSSAKDALKKKQTLEVAQLAALGLLKFPGDRHLTLHLLDASDQLGFLELAEAALESLGPPQDGDVTHLNAIAGMALKKGDPETAYEMFAQLLDLDPENEGLIGNISAVMVSLERFQEAIDLLENALPKAKEPLGFVNRLTKIHHLRGDDVKLELAKLDERLFQACDTRSKARVHAKLSLFLEDFPETERGLKEELKFGENKSTRFELGEVQLAQSNFSDGLRNYGVRLEAFPHLHYCKPLAKPYRGEFLIDESLFIWAEQGIGDELMFSLFFDLIKERVRNVIVATDFRLIHSLQQRFPTWTFVNRHTLPEEPPVTDYACSSGDLFLKFMQEISTFEKPFEMPFLLPDQQRLTSIKNILGTKNRPRIGISWKGGAGVNGIIRSVKLEDMMNALAEGADIDVISFQYTENHEQEVLSLGDRRVALSGLNNKEDLEGVFCLMHECDAIFTVDNAVAHFASFLGVPCFVLIPAAQVQFRWKSECMKNLFFPKAHLVRQEMPGDWQATLELGWARVLDYVGVKDQ